MLSPDAVTCTGTFSPDAKVICQVVSALAGRLAERPAAEWLERLARAGVPAGLVKGVLEALAEEGASPLTGVAPSVPGTVRRPPPRLGEHTAAVREAGWEAFARVPRMGDRSS